MRRKLIRQGTGLTIYLPKKWVDGQSLTAGDEVEIGNVNENLTISAVSTRMRIKELTLTVERPTESVLRTLIVNAYRAGYDKIILNDIKDQKMIAQIVSTYLLGFDVFQKESNVLIESVAEPSYDTFEDIMQKQFFIVLDIMRSLEMGDVGENVFRIQRYNNFLKRCLQKKTHPTVAISFVWQFLSYLTQIARKCQHLNGYILRTKKKLSKNEQLFHVEIIESFALLQKQYLSNSLHKLMEVHQRENDLLHRGFRLLRKEDAAIMHYLISIANLIYHANSPLAGIIELTEFPTKPLEI